MIKKILIYLSVCTGFIFCFLFGKYINTLAYFENSNTFGVYPAKLDINNYNYQNIFDEEKYLSEYNTYSNETGLWTTSANPTGFNYSIITNQSGYTSNRNINKLPLIPSGSYTLSIYIITNYTNYNNMNIAFYNNDGVIVNSPISKKITNIVTFNFEINEDLYLDIRLEGNNGYITFKGIQLSEGNEFLEYYPFFKFGNMVGYQLNLYNPTSSSITTYVKIYNYNNVVVYKRVTISANSYYELIGNVSTTSQGTIDTRFYLPYNISNDGTISFDYKLSIVIDNTDIVIKSDENIGNDTYFYFEPVFNAYYKGEPTNNLYFKNSYSFNSITYVGFNVNGQLLNSAYFSCFGNAYDNVCLQDSIFVNVNSNSNILANNVISTGIRNYFNFNDVFITTYDPSYSGTLTYELYSYLFSFQLNIGNTNDSINSGVEYSVNISNISLSIVSDNSTSVPLPNNPNTNNKYNTCDAWYDIPCQLGNAVTYVIYEAPIISPIVVFITTFIDGLQYVITYIKWFEGLGIVFSLFIFILMIRLLIMLIKGSNDDRGGNK